MCLKMPREPNNKDPKNWYGYVLQRKSGNKYCGIWYKECGMCVLGEEKFYDPLAVPNIEKMRICANDDKGFYGYAKLYDARNTRSYILWNVLDVVRDNIVILLAEFRSLRDIGNPAIVNEENQKNILADERKMISFRARYRTLLCEIK